MSLQPREHLRHILDEADYLIHRSQTLDFHEFETNADLRRSFVRSPEIIGEATKQLPPAVRDGNPHVDWKGMAGLRDRLIHGYFAVDYSLIWGMVIQKVPNPARRDQRDPVRRRL